MRLGVSRASTGAAAASTAAAPPPPRTWRVQLHRAHRGQYTAYEFGETLRTSGLLASMGRVGSAFDNAMAESFFATLKAELVYRGAWPTRHELEMEVLSYIEGFDNPRRWHSRLHNLSPADFQKMPTTQNEASGPAGVTSPAPTRLSPWSARCSSTLPSRPPGSARGHSPVGRRVVMRRAPEGRQRGFRSRAWAGEGAAPWATACGTAARAAPR